MIIDCSSPITPSRADALKSLGISYIVRYLDSLLSWKTLRKSEAETITSRGMNLISVYEKSPTYAGYFTESRGVTDAKNAMAYAKRVGQPQGTTIYFAVDYNAQPADMPRILTYFQAIRKTLTGYHIGAYGSYAVLEYLHTHGGADYYWQTYAWSRGKQVSFANLYQYQNGVTDHGINFDRDRIYKDPGGWKPMSTLLKLGDRGAEVKTLQENLNKLMHTNIATDEVYGSQTAAAVKAFEQIHHLNVDGIAGTQVLGEIEKLLHPAPAPTQPSEPQKPVTPPSNPAPPVSLPDAFTQAEQAYMVQLANIKAEAQQQVADAEKQVADAQAKAKEINDASAQAQNILKGVLS